jgi:hypothetical protein
MIQATCLGCGQKLKVKDQLAGKKVKCPGCGDPMRIPTAAETVEDVGLPLPPPPPQARPSPPVAKPAPPPPPPPAPAVPQPAFDFGQPTPAAAADPAVFGGLAESTGTPLAPRRRRTSPVKSWATHGALVGALAGALLVVLLPPPEAVLVEALHKGLPKLEPDRIRGALVGLAGAFLVGMLIVAVVGKSIESFCAVVVLMLGGAIYGGYRRADPLEMGWSIVTAGTAAGILAGAMLGLVVGAIIAAARGRS